MSECKLSPVYFTMIKTELFFCVFEVCLYFNSFMLKLLCLMFYVLSIFVYYKGVVSATINYFSNL